MACRLPSTSRMWTEARSTAYEDATAQERAGFVAYLVSLAPMGAPIMPKLMPALTLFTSTAGLEDAKSLEERQARMDAYYAKYPLSAALRLAFERAIRSSAAERGLEQDHDAAARWLGRGALTPVAPTVERSVAVSGLRSRPATCRRTLSSGAAGRSHRERAARGPRGGERRQQRRVVGAAARARPHRRFRAAPGRSGRRHSTHVAGHARGRHRVLGSAPQDAQRRSPGFAAQCSAIAAWHTGCVTPYRSTWHAGREQASSSRCSPQ